MVQIIDRDLKYVTLKMPLELALGFDIVKAKDKKEVKLKDNIEIRKKVGKRNYVYITEAGRWVEEVEPDEEEKKAIRRYERDKAAGRLSFITLEDLKKKYDW